MGRYTEKTTISYDDYLRLEGLLTIARDVERQSKAILRNVAKIIGEDPDGDGHAVDAVYNNYTARELLEKSGITVEPREEE